jgi:hypothetical protein
VLPILQGWTFFVITLSLLATEFDSGRRWVKAGRQPWPWLDRWIERYATIVGASSRLKEFEHPTDPSRRIRIL